MRVPAALLPLGKGALSSEFVRRLIVQAAVRQIAIMILTPFFYYCLCLSEADEPMLIQTFISESGIKAFYVCILYRLARVDEP